MDEPPKAELFSSQAEAYRAYRPTYPEALFDWLASLAPDRSLAWDCACGSGQATLALARYFDHVVATDVSAAQLAELQPSACLAMRDTVSDTGSHDTRRPSVTDSVSVRVEPAERSSLGTGSVSLTLVAQALHWFDLDAFYQEVRRVSRPGAAIVALTYDLPRVSTGVDGVIDDLYAFLDNHWPQGREHVETRYADIPFDFTRRPAPDISMNANWTAPNLLGFLRSWSAVASYKRSTGIDIVDGWVSLIVEAWADASDVRDVQWPLTILAGRVSEAV
jgi:SAM-dependent methyltransferase